MTLTLDTIYRDFDKSLRKFIRGRVADNEIAEDILHDVYIKIHNNIGQVREADSLTSWVYQITRNTIIDQYRRTRPEVELEDVFVAQQASEPDIFSELAASVRTMLNCLPPSSRQVLELADLRGTKQEEVASLLGLSLSGAKSRIQRARQKLKQAFLDCCHFEFDHNGRAMDFQPNCDRCAEHSSLSGCNDESCGN
jgi:RNA polymerase sigma-70 factor (ECF subfamily)